MESNIYLGKTNCSISKKLIEVLQKNYDEKPYFHHIFLVPDRVSVLTEIKIFESLKIESTISIEVMTLSRLALKILGDKRVVSKDTSCMLIQKILKENKKDLKCFNKTISMDLSTNLYEIISQFKSCKINFDEVCVKNKDDILKNKLEDIALIYRKYEESLKAKNLLDSMDRLDILTQKIKDCEFVKNSYFYVCNFDGFTYQGFQLISAICQNAYEFNIGVLDSTNPINEHIYNKAFLEKVRKVLRFSDRKVNEFVCEDVEKGDFAHLRDNLFSFNLIQKKMEKDSISLFEAPDFRQEVLFCASNIKHLMMTKNYSFNDFVVVVPNLQDNFKTVEKVFNEYKFNFFLDKTEKFENSVIVKFVKCLFNLILDNYSKVSVVSFVKNPLFNMEVDKVEDFEDVLNRFNINSFYDLANIKFKDEKAYESFFEIRNVLIDKTQEFRELVAKRENNFEDFVCGLEKFLLKNNVFEILQEMTKKFVEKGQIKLAKLYEQYYEEIENIFNGIKSVLINEKCDFDMFISTFMAGIKNVNLSTSPISTNAIFVGDSDLSFFDKSKVYFVLEVEEDVFPRVIGDYGLISDKEIKKLSEDYLLEPSINEINFKARFKAFDTLLKAEDKLFLSYNYSSTKFLRGKILDDISNLFSVENMISGFCNLPIVKFDEQSFFVLNNNYKVAYDQFVREFRGYIDGQVGDKNKMAVLFNALNIDKKDLEKFFFRNEIKITNNLFFLKNKVSVSEIESFMTCPFLHFCSYGLKLKEKKTSDISPIDVGLILHGVAEKFLKENVLPINEDKLKGIAKKIFDKVLDDELFENLKLDEENKILIKNLRRETIRFCEALNYQAKFSKFRPVYFEERFGDNGKIKTIDFEVLNKKISLVGQVDRIDVFDEYFRIIDYKTGNCDRTLKDLYFGKKVQLDAYLDVVKRGIKLLPAGAYYFPIKSGFGEDEEDNKKYTLEGETLDDEKVINASDMRFCEAGVLKSDLVDVKFSENDGDSRKMTRWSKVAKYSDIEAQGDYALKLIEKAVKDILALDVTPKPLELGSSPCKSCKFFGLCKFSESFGNVRRNPNVKVESTFFDFLKGGENGKV